MIRFFGFCVFVLGSAQLLTSCTQAAGDIPADPEVTQVDISTEGIAGEPHLTTTSGGMVLASWVERRDDVAFLVFSSLEDGTWTEKKTITSGDNWFINWADVPSIAVSDSGTLMAHWLERLGDGRYAYGAKYSVSNDDGATWSSEEWLHADRSETEHGFVSIAPADGGFMTTWLDGNRYGRGLNEMSLHARWVSDSGELGAEVALDSRTCDCCPVSITRTGSNEFAVFYRDRTESEIRDIAVARFKDGSWSESESLNEDGWMIDACPVNGPASDNLLGTLGVGWFTMAGGTPTVNVAFSADQGDSFSDPVSIGLGNPGGRVALRMRNADELVIAWMEGASKDDAGIESGIFVRTVTRAGVLGNPIRLTNSSTSRAAGYPRLERTQEGMMALWTKPGEPATLQSALINW